MHDGTTLNTFINLSTVGMCHLKIVNASQVPVRRFKKLKKELYSLKYNNAVHDGTPLNIYILRVIIYWSPYN